MSASEETLTLLRSIDAGIKQLVEIVRPLAPKPVASDRDLDGTHGDPTVKFDPRDWLGPSCKGLRFSACPAPFLDLLAETFDYFANKAESTGEQYNGKPVAPYKRQDAARARGWAARVRAGLRPPAATGGGWEERVTWPTVTTPSDSDIGF